MKALVLGAFLVIVPAALLAQVGSPTDFSANPHPAMPWSGITNPTQVDYGQVIRYIQVPPQQVAIEVYVPTPEGLPRQTQRQVVEVPGYYVAETTTGYYYPERWSIEQLSAGLYQWRKLPPEFRKK